jgi:hypothetical protein
VSQSVISAEKIAVAKGIKFFWKKNCKYKVFSKAIDRLGIAKPQVVEQFICIPRRGAGKLRYRSPKCGF